MTISGTSSRNDYTAGGASCTFAYTFPITADTALAVYVDNVLVTNYTVTGAGSASGGTVTFATVPVAGAPVAILRDESFTQDLDLVEHGVFSADALETELDHEVMLDQQLAEGLSRALQFSPSSTCSGVVVPEPGAFGTVLGWDGAGNLINTCELGCVLLAVNTTVALTGGQSNFVNYYFAPTATGTTQQVAGAFVLNSNAVCGNRIALFAGTQTGGGTGAGTANPITAANFVVQQNATDSTAQLIGIEIDINANKANATLDMTPAQVGYSAVSAGSKVAGIAYYVSGVPQWVEGIQIAQGAICSSGYAFRYKGNGVSGGAVTIAANSDVCVNTNKVTITASSGNTTVAGTLCVQGLTTTCGGLQIGTGGSFAAGRFYRDATVGVQFSGVAGTTGSEFLMYNSLGTVQLLCVASQVFTFGPTGTSVQVKINSDRNLAFANQTCSVGAQAATLTNAPTAGNPDFWLRTVINGTNYAIPCWKG